MDKNKCPKCGGEMEPGELGSLGGFLNPLSRGGMFIRWIGDKGGNKTIKVYSCKSCGYLESYAK